MSRKQPYSNKKKKQQLREKRELKQVKLEKIKENDSLRSSVTSQEVLSDDVTSDIDDNGSDDEQLNDNVDDLFDQNGKVNNPVSSLPPSSLHNITLSNYKPTLPVTSLHISKFHSQPGKSDTEVNRFQLHYLRETDSEVQRRKELASLPIERVPESSLELSVEDIYPSGSVLDMPKRPDWRGINKDELALAEEKMFSAFIEDIYSKYPQDELSYFEHNLETWRQLWMVLEKSNIIMLITDVRHPVLHFSPTLYSHVVNDLQRIFVLVLNKVDLVPASVAVAWRHYFIQNFPGTHVICFSAYPDDEASLEPSKKIKLKFPKHRKRLISEAVGVDELIKAVKEIYKGKRDLSDLKKPQRSISIYNEDIESSGSSDEDENLLSNENEHKLQDVDLPNKNALIIGMVGHPNVGKSSIINGLMGQKVVSTSRTPGHTKRFQTLYISPNVCLCDCPGLVFPSLVPKQIQILSGMYPLSQLREPYTSVGYLTARNHSIISQLSLVHPLAADPTAKSNKSQKLELPQWSSFDICEAWAVKRGFYTAKAARPDIHRAANNLLRLATDGRITLFFRPKGYSVHKHLWEKHSETQSLLKSQHESLKLLESKRLFELGCDNGILDDYAIAEKMIASSKNKQLVKKKKKKATMPGDNKFAMLMNESEGNSDIN